MTALSVGEKKAAVQKLLDELTRISLEMEEGSIKALYELRKLFYDQYGKPPFRELASEMKEETLFMLWAAQELLKNLWLNFGEGVPGFPKRQGGVFLQEFTVALGRGIQVSIAHMDFTGYFGQALKAYFGLGNLCQIMAQTEGGGNWVTL